MAFPEITIVFVLLVKYKIKKGIFYYRFYLCWLKAVYEKGQGIDIQFVSPKSLIICHFYIREADNYYTLL